MLALGTVATDLRPAAAAGAAYRLDLHRAGDFVGQVDPKWCIGASMQMMLNIVGPADDHSAETQTRLMELARSYQVNTSWAGRGGASPQGLASGLATLGAGAYRVTSTATLEDAAELIARAIRATGRPAAISVHRGTHSWVVAGFEATADPRTSGSFDVTGLVVLDPWYPRSYRGWGAPPRPGSTLSLAGLAEHYLPWERDGRISRWSGRYRLVLPVVPTAPLERHTRPH